MDTRIMSKLRHLMDTLFPPQGQCLCCGEKRLKAADEDSLCAACRIALEEAYEPGLFLEAEGIDGVYAPFYYEKEARVLIKKLKYGQVKRAALPLSLAMAKRLSSAGHFDAIVPIPLHKARLRDRGFNQAEALAAYIARDRDIPLLLALERKKNTRQQVRLNREKRRANVADAFACREQVEGLRLLLVDDVCTTGATAQSAAAVLRRAGAAEVFLCTAAFAELHGARKSD